MSTARERRLPPGGIPFAPELGDPKPLSNPPRREEQRRAFNGLYRILHQEASPLKAKLDLERGGVSTDLTPEQRKIAKGLEVTQASVERATGGLGRPDEVISHNYRGGGRYRNEFTSRNPERREFYGEAWEQNEGVAAEHILRAGARRIHKLMHYKGDGTWFINRRKEALEIQRQMQIVEVSTRTYREAHTNTVDMPWDVRVEQEQAFNFHQSPENAVFDSSVEPGRAHMDNDWLMAADIMEERLEFEFNEHLPGLIIVPARSNPIILSSETPTRVAAGAIPATIGEIPSVAGVPATLGAWGYPQTAEAPTGTDSLQTQDGPRRRRRRWPWLLIPIPVAVGFALLQCTHSGAPEKPVLNPAGSPTPEAPLVAAPPPTETEVVATATSSPAIIEMIVPTQPVSEPTRAATPTAVFGPGSPVPVESSEPAVTPARGKVPPELIEPVPTTKPRSTPAQISAQGR